MSGLIAEELGRLPMSPYLAATLSRAAGYADAQAHLQVTIEHLLLALSEDPEASVVLKACNVDLARLAADVSDYLGRFEERAREGMPHAVVLSPMLKQILQAAASAAGQARRREINGAIVLAAIVGEGKSPAAQMLRAQGMTFESAIRALQKAQSPDGAAGRPRPPSAEDVIASARERIQTRTAPGLGDLAPRQQMPPPAPSPPAEVPRASPEPPPQAAASDAAAPDFAPLAPAGPAGEVEIGATPLPPPANPLATGAAGYEPEWQPAAAADREEPVAATARVPAAAAEPMAESMPPVPVALEAAAPTAASVPEPVAEPALPQARAPQLPPQSWAPPPRPGPPAGGPAPRPAAVRAPPPIPASAPAHHGSASPPPPAGAPVLPPTPSPRGEGVAAGPQPALPPWSPGGEPRPTRRPPPGVGAAAAPLQPMVRQPLPSARPGPVPAAPAPPEAARRRAPGAQIQAGQLAENIPRSMRVAVPVVVEARVARAHVKAIAEGLQGGGLVHRHEVLVSKAMSVRLRAPDGGFTIETASPETQWIDNVLGVMSDDYASWRWAVTPRERGKRRLQLVVSARTVGADGLTAETALPDQVIEVKVGINYALTARRWGGWLAAAVAGGLLARFGEDAYGLVLMLLDKSGGG